MTYLDPLGLELTSWRWKVGHPSSTNSRYWSSPPRTMRPAIVLALALPTARAVAVTRLDEANFEGQVKKGELWLVAFVAPWCGHCKQLAPVLDEVAESIDSAARSAPPVRVGAIDCSSNRAFCDTRRVKGFPTVRLMHEDRTWEHKGARSKAALLEAVARLRRPAVFELGGISKLDALHRSARVVFYLGRTGHREHESDAAMRAGFAEAARERQLSDNFASGGRKLTAHLLALANRKPPVRADGSPAALVVLRLEAGEAARVLELPPGDAGEDDGAPAGAPGVASAGVAAAHSPTGARNGMHRRAIDAFVSAHREPLLSLIDADNLVRLSSLDKPLVILVVDPQSIRAPMEGARPLGLDDFADGARGLGPAIRALSRDAALYDRCAPMIPSEPACTPSSPATHRARLGSLCARAHGHSIPGHATEGPPPTPCAPLSPLRALAHRPVCHTRRRRLQRDAQFDVRHSFGVPAADDGAAPRRQRAFEIVRRVASDR